MTAAEQTYLAVAGAIIEQFGIVGKHILMGKFSLAHFAELEPQIAEAEARVERECACDLIRQRDPRELD